MIGILALQGDFEEHRKILELLGQKTLLIKKPMQLQVIDGLVIGGGESTAISLLIDKYGFKKPLQKFIFKKPTFATCAGLILLARNVIEGDSCLQMIDVAVKRNAFGRQTESFEADIAIDVLGQKPYPAVFIRAPWIEKVEKNVEIIARYNNRIVGVRQGNIMALAFHPELTKDTRIHQLFVSMVTNKLEARTQVF